MAAEEQEEKMSSHKRKLSQFRAKPVAVELDEDEDEEDLVCLYSYTDSIDIQLL